MHRLFRSGLLAPALAIAAATALGGCVVYPAPGYGPYGYPAYYAPAPVVGFGFGGWGGHGYWHGGYWR
ncbi:MAG: hypothetical protein JOY65_12265 [Acetobacteraceae bacterium]|jgi:hypothetical protein|nr:hypothetical protein [Acetobacteraceae bacterium]MBV8870172.1 hypothetical protein [Acetobacteraceae bacterium]MBV9775518.1 hypothetical protein [Acetobacteraceae bacterium]